MGLRSPNIVTLYGLFLPGDSADSGGVALVMDYVPHTLGALLSLEPNPETGRLGPFTM